MMDESIEGSPKKGNRSYREVRLHRKNKRKRSQVAASASTGTAIGVPTLADLYSDDIEETRGSELNKTFAVEDTRSGYNNYNPFKEQLLLATADGIACSQRAKPDLPATRGFQSYMQFVTQQESVSESELLLLCVETDKLIKEESFAERMDQTPPANKSKSVVELILEDFCSSPGSPEQSVKTHITPTFKFRHDHKSLRTYRRRRIANQLVDGQPECVVEDDCLSNASELSVQEDPTLLVETEVSAAVESVALNESQKICENLLNLSAFFSTNCEEHPVPAAAPSPSPTPTQTQSSDGALYLTALEIPESVQTSGTVPTPPPTAISQLVEEVLVLRQKLSNRLDRRQSFGSCEDFHGFSELLSPTDGGINVFSEQVQSMKSPSACGVSPTRSSTDYDLNISGIAELFDGNDAEWGDEDSELFANFKTQNPSEKSHKAQLREPVEGLVSPSESQHGQNRGFLGFQTASRRKITMSKEAQERAARILATLPDLGDISPKKASYPSTGDDEKPTTSKAALSKVDRPAPARTEKNLDIDFGNIELSEWFLEDHEQTDAPKTLDFVGFHTASKKPVEISEQAKQKAANILTNLPDIPHKPDKKDMEQANETPEPEIFVGFPTASKKPVAISEQAKQKAANILTNLPDIPHKPDKKDLEQANETAEPEIFVGFRTASKKPVAISEQAKQKAANILTNLPDIPHKPDKKDLEQANETAEPEIFVGFRTASKKPVAISEQAKQKAANILTNLPDIPVKTSRTKAAEVNSSISARTLTNLPNLHEKPPEGDEKALVGFRTASKRVIAISEQAQQKAASILMNLPEISMSTIDESAPELGMQSPVPVSTTSAVPDEFKDIQLSEWPVSEEIVQPENNDVRNRKSVSAEERHHAVRKETPKPLTKPIDNSFTSSLICSTPLTHKQRLEVPQASSVSQLAVRSPLASCLTQSIISRKNLLSLSKRKKFRCPIMATNEATNNSRELGETPLQAKVAKGHETPNRLEFFNSKPTTSTPQREASCGAYIDSDLRAISWSSINENEQENSVSLNSSGHLQTSCSNITYIERNPTPRQREQRLTMYGEAPPLSPLPLPLPNTSNSCRISGLRRNTRGAAAACQAGKGKSNS